MATTRKKPREALDWYGDPIPGVCLAAKRRRDVKPIRLVTDSDGTKWWEGWMGDRLPYDAPYMRVEDSSGKVLYDSRLEPPADAKLLPGYIGGQQVKRQPRPK
jgi:hypothetical protein